VSWKPFIRAISGQREKYLLHIAWDTEEDLENYRNSEFFNEVWTFTKNYSTANLRLGVDKLSFILMFFILNLDNFKFKL
jgi:hypothetical protein